MAVASPLPQLYLNSSPIAFHKPVLSLPDLDGLALLALVCLAEQAHAYVTAHPRAPTLEGFAVWQAARLQGEEGRR
jgi:hypothetical protein